MAFVTYLQERKAETLAQTKDPWLIVLERISGRIGNDGVERISTQAVFDILEVPQRQRAGAYRRLARSMRALGWSPIRARGLTRGGFEDIVRGYAREAVYREGHRKVTLGF